MNSRTTLFTALTLSLALAAPIAFAQSQEAADPAAQSPTAQAQSATASDPAAAQASTAPEQSAAPAAPETGAEAKRITWSDLDADKDGKLTKTEAASVEALTQVFDDADADKDGALTPDEYKAFVAKNAPGTSPTDGQG